MGAGAEVEVEVFPLGEELGAERSSSLTMLQSPAEQSHEVPSAVAIQTMELATVQSPHWFCPLHSSCPGVLHEGAAASLAGVRTRIEAGAAAARVTKAMAGRYMVALAEEGCRSLSLKGGLTGQR